MSDDSNDRGPGSAMSSQPDYNRVIRTCPICGRELEERKCKLICTDPRCYFMSCADSH